MTTRAKGVIIKVQKKKGIDKMDFKNKTVGQIIGTILGQVAVWFLSAVFIWWGWNIFAEHFNLPEFEYMEVFAMRMALTFIMKILWQKTETRG